MDCIYYSSKQIAPAQNALTELKSANAFQAEMHPHHLYKRVEVDPHLFWEGECLKES